MNTIESDTRYDYKNINRLKWHLWLKVSYDELKDILSKSNEYADKQYILLERKPLGNFKMKILIILLIFSVGLYFQCPSYSYSIIYVIPLTIFLSLFVCSFLKYLFLPGEIKRADFLGEFRICNYLNYILLIYAILLASIIAPIFSQHQHNTDKLHDFLISNLVCIFILTVVLLAINSFLFIKKKYLNLLLICELVVQIIELRRWYNFLASDISVPILIFLMVAPIISIICTNCFVFTYKSSFKQ